MPRPPAASPASTGAGTRRATATAGRTCSSSRRWAAAPRQVTSGDWGVADITWHPDGRTVAFTADRGPEPDLHPRTTIWAVDVDAPGDRRGAARGPGARRLGDHAGVVAGRSLDRGASASSSGPARRRQPGVRRRPGRRLATAPPPRAGPRSPDRQLGRLATSPAGSSTAGPARSGSTTDRLVARLSDRGRSHPRRLRRRTARRAPDDALDRRRHRRPHATIAAAAGPASSRRSQTDGHAAPWSSSTVEAARRRPATADHARLALAGRASRCPRCSCVEAPGPGGPIESWIASPAGAGGRAAADRRRHPRRAARRVGTDAAHRGVPARRARLSRGPAEHPRLGDVRPRLDPAPARRLGRRRRRRRPRRGRPRRRRSGSRTRTGSA